jgi:hypothetical protein
MGLAILSPYSLEDLNYQSMVYSGLEEYLTAKLYFFVQG